MDLRTRSALVKEQALKLGFMACGITHAGRLDQEEARLHDWLNQGLHGGMTWMENHFEKRLNPAELVPGANSVLSLLFNYYPPQKQDEGTPGFSVYAYGDDYHELLRQKLRQLVHALEEHFGTFEHRIFTDSAPVLERALAARAGLGWIGKHSLLLRKSAGSFFFIAEIISDLELLPDGPVTDHCGKCTACIDACPTDAIVDAAVVDARKCISYLTIELKGEIPDEFTDKMENWVFGCDICQMVCPWNRFASPHSEPALGIRPEIRQFSLTDWMMMDEVAFGRIFKKSAVKRTKYEGFRRNLMVLNRRGE